MCGVGWFWTSEPKFVLKVTVCYSKGGAPALFCVPGIDHCDQRQLRVRKGLFLLTLLGHNPSLKEVRAGTEEENQLAVLYSSYLPA